jgi:ABC-type transporter Mla maintaining outer membrane lipid asymmetry permease subunit MlaE
MASPSTIIRKPVDAVAGALEEVGRQLSFFGRVLVQVPAVFRPKRMAVVMNLMSDITIGAGALIVGGGMIFVIFSMSFFVGTEVGLQGFKGLEQIGAQSLPA